MGPLLDALKLGVVVVAYRILVSAQSPFGLIRVGTGLDWVWIGSGGLETQGRRLGLDNSFSI